MAWWNAEKGGKQPSEEQPLIDCHGSGPLPLALEYSSCDCFVLIKLEFRLHRYRISEKNSDIMEKIPSGCPSPAKIEKTDSSSSRNSGSPLHWDIESYIISDRLNLEARIRPSSWDDSDDDFSTESERNTDTNRLYSNDTRQLRGSVTAEINEIKKQFFETLEKVRQENDIQDKESLKEKVEAKLNSDRRQSPARMRRRTKSSSSSSPILESKSYSSPEKPEKLTQPEALLDEISSKNLEFDSKFYLNGFFTELRSKRISLINSTPIITETGKFPDCDDEYIPVYNEVKCPNVTENDEYFCKTSRKLSQILEVEENKTDMEKSSEEKVENSEFFFTSLKKPEETDFSPLQTARSKKNEKILENAEETKKKKLKSVSYEELGNFENVKPYQGSLSERYTRIFDSEINDNNVSLTVENGKMHMNSPRNLKSSNAKKEYQLISSASPKEGNVGLPIWPSPKNTEKKFDSRESLKIDLTKTFTSENSTPRKSTERSEKSHTEKILSAKSRRSCDLESPKFTINLGRDSGRSLRIEDVITPDSLRKNLENKTSSELKTPLFEYHIPKKTNKSPGTSELKFKFDSSLESKKERSLYITPRSPSLESVKSILENSKEVEINYFKSHKSSRESYLKKKSQRKDDQASESETTEQNLTLMTETTKSSSSVESSRSYENPFNISNRTESFTKILNPKITKVEVHKPQKSARMPNSKSSRSLKSDKTRSSKTVKDNFINQLSDQETPRSDQITELSLPLGISKRTKSQRGYCLSPKIELDDTAKDSDRSQSNNSKNSSHRASELGSSSSKNSISKRSTPPTLKTTSKTNSSRSSRSKDSLENRNDAENAGNFRIAAWKELEKVCDTLSNCTSVSSASRRNTWRESDTPSQQHSDRKELSDFTLTPKNNNSIERSRKSSRKSEDSQALGQLQNSPTRSIKKKSRQNSWTLEEQKTNINPYVEKPNIVAGDEKTRDQIFIFEEDNGSEKNHLSQKPESGVESGKLSSNRLSIINEVSFEELEVSVENEEKGILEQSRSHLRRSRRQVSPQNVKKISKDNPKASNSNLKKNPSDESVPQLSNFDDGRWDELIEKFNKSSNTSSISKNTFSHSFLHKKENSTEGNTTDNKSHEKQEDSSILSKKNENRYETFKKNLPFEKTVKGKDEDLKNAYIVYEEPLLETVLKEKDIRSKQNSRNLYYFNTNKEGTSEIGEFGDIAYWNACQSDITDSAKPRDHGDGIQNQKTSEVLVLSEKGEKDVKTQRHLWTELKVDFRDSKRFLNDFFLEIEDDINFKNFIPIGLKTSKSDNCIKRKTNVGSDCQILAACELLNEYNRTPKNMEKKFQEFENCKKRKNFKSISKCTAEHSSLESLAHGKYSENEELECEITPRLSKSLSDLQILQIENVINRSEETIKTSGILCFEKSTDNSREEKEFTDLNIFLAYHEKLEKMSVKSNNWLNFKNPERKKSCKQDQKTMKKKKNSASSKDSFHEYLSSSKSRRNIPHLKLRNSNCFQNFYKRFTSVFCLTSNSSAATSN